MEAMTLLELPTVLVERMQYRADMAGMTLYDYLSVFLGEEAEEDEELVLTPELRSDIDKAIEANEAGTNIPHAEVMRRIARYLE